MSKQLNDKITADCHSGICLFGSVPPKAHVTKDKLENYAQSFVASMEELSGLDGVIVYEIQDEEGRDPSIDRPFEYSPTHEPVYFAKLLRDYSENRIETIVYRGIPAHPKETMEPWLSTVCNEAKSQTIVLVGASSSQVSQEESIGYSVVEAAKIIDSKDEGFVSGGIWLPERHRDKGDEVERLSEKVQSGIKFFTSQVIFNCDLAIWALRDYDRKCKLTGQKPGRLIFVFAPFCREDTAIFLKWLGVEIPLGTEKRILSRSSKAEALQECIEICIENFKRICQAIETYNIVVPIGIAVESVSKYRDEFNAALNLFKALKTEQDIFFEKRRIVHLERTWWLK